VFGLQKNWYACSMPDASSVPGIVEHATGKPCPDPRAEG
jgi:hypothetical protein